MAENEFRVLGPPGTGKTRYLIRQIEKAAEKHGADNIVVASYTRTAAATLIGRQATIPNENIGTLHALCYRSLGSPEIAEINAASFNEEYPASAISLASNGKMDEMAADAVFETEGDRHLATYNLYRAKCMDLALMPKSTIEWVKRWDLWKMRNKFIDFTDMIDIVRIIGDPLPGEPQIGIYDECFPGHICVTMADGSQHQIRDIVENHIHGGVLSFNEKNGVVEEKQITGWHKIPLNNRKILSYGPLQATDNHPIFTKNGYQEFKNVVDLACMEVLWLNHEKLQSDYSINSNGKVYHPGIVTWRRFNSEKSGSKWKCKDEVLPGCGTSRIPKLEISKSSKMGTNTTQSSAKNRLWREGLRFQHDITSSIHRILEKYLSRWNCKTKTHNSGYHKTIRSYGIGRMVYGRWRIAKRKNYYKYIRFYSKRFKNNCKIFQCNGSWVQNLYRQIQGTGFAFQCEGNNGLAQNYSTIYSSIIGIQNKNKREQTGQNITRHTDCFWQKISTSMPHLWSKFYSTKISNSLWQQFLLQKKNGQASTGVEKKESLFIRNSFGRLRDLWKQIYCNKVQNRHGYSKDMQQALQGNPCLSNTQREEWVYCIDVEDNHNFFANNILVHNCQDFNKLEFRLLRHWAQFQDYVILAGDDDQCHPAGTLISTSNRGQVPIEDLNPNEDTLWNFDKHGLQIYRAKSFKVASRWFDGIMVTINNNLQVTYDHRCIARWNKRSVGAKAVYLMRRGNNWRIGTTDLIRKKAAGMFGVGQRARQEGADEAWVISIHDNPIHAMMAEERLSMKYGISQMCFIAPRSGAQLRMTQEELDSYHDEISASARPMELLTDNGLSYAHPMWVPDGRQRGKTAWQEIRAANLFADYMDLITVYDDITSKANWIPETMYSINKEQKQCHVFSLDVQPYRTYIANGIIVHNCIYTFTGASPEAFMDPNIPPENKRILKQSYRLPRVIHAYSQDWIKQISNREPKEFNPKEEEGNIVYSKSTYKTPQWAVEYAAKQAQDGKTTMILASCSYMLNYVKDCLRDSGLTFHNPYRVTRTDWNPLGNFNPEKGGKRITTRARIVAFLTEALSVSGKPYWNMRDLSKWLDLIRVRGVLKKGAKERIMEILESQDGMYSGSEEDFYRSVFEDFALEKALDRNIPWFRSVLLAAKTKAVEYPLKIYEKHGLEALRTKPKIIIGTIHSVKGGEADSVVLFPDVSLNAMMEYQKDKDPVIRTFYVGMTRARENLVICRPVSDLCVKMH